MSPQSIAHYRIVSKLGEGGMGAVYRATDTKLHRDVAIKVLPEALANDADYLARFQREAQVLASLNHPNIAILHGIEQNALIMELVPGVTLEERIAAGALPLAEALGIAKQIAEALEAAHEKGVIHRDLKPANVKVTPEGVVKVLDFGLAKNTESAAGTTANSPTLTIRSTQLGLIMGTAGYMAPEQAAGKPVDKRAVIWSFGVVLYEMLTGARLFEGETVAHTLAHVLTQELDLNAVEPGLRPLVRRCLERDPRKRLRDIGDARLAIEEYLAEPKSSTAAPLPAAPARRPILPWALAALLAAAGIAGWWKATRPEPPRPLVRLHLDVPEETPFRRGLTGGMMAISPDGARLALVLQSHDTTSLFLRPLSQNQLTELRGTEDAASPFFSPDGEWIGFAASGKLKKISVNGGAAVTLCDAPSMRGASWGEDGNIVAALQLAGPLSRVPGSGGPPVAVTRLEGGDRSHRWPQVLPGARAVLATISFTPGNYDDAEIAVFSLDTGKKTTVQRGALFGRYLAGRRLAWVHGNTLFAAPFDLARMAVTGASVPLLEDVRRSTTSGADLDVSPSGALLYHSGQGDNRTVLSWLDEAGNLSPLHVPPEAYYSPRLSPDGKRLAYYLTSTAATDIWVRDLDREVPSRLTFLAGINMMPVWTPDGRHIAFNSGGPGHQSLYWIRSDGSGSPQRIAEESASVQADSFTPDGKRLVFEQGGASGFHVYTATVEGDPDHPRLGKPELLLGTPANERQAMISPDGRWVAYTSDELGAIEVYVRPFPGPGGRWQISQQGGAFPRWSPNGHELLYRDPGLRIVRVDYSAKGDSFSAGRPRPWSDTAVVDLGGAYTYDVAADGKRLLAISAQQDAATKKPDTQLNVVLNFFDEVKRRVK